MRPDDDATGKDLTAFLALTEGDANALQGAVMVTDTRGFPREMRATAPVRVSRVQRAAYGDRLWPYIAEELIGGPLLADLAREPDVVFVNRRDLLSVPSAAPVIYVSSAGDYIATPSHDSLRVSGGSGDDDIMLEQHGSEPRQDLDDAASIIQQCLDHFDPITAFDRVVRALGLLAENDERFRLMAGER